ncbi:hypothetical protein BH23ACT4_BH23ACT4_11080 [soil metagenome]
MFKSFTTVVRRGLILVPLFLALLPSAHAGATPMECDEAREQFAIVVRQAVRGGLNIDRIDEINEFIPIVEACASESVNDLTSGVDRWGPLVASYFRPEDVSRALCLMELESAGDPGAKNPTSGASGLMQVMPFWAGHFGYSTADLFDPWTNLEVAAVIRDQQGWDAWSPYGRGMCR